MKRTIALFLLASMLVMLPCCCSKQSPLPSGDGTEIFRWYGDTYPIAFQITDVGFFALISKDGETPYALGFGSDAAHMEALHTFPEMAEVSSFHADGRFAVWCEKVDGCYSYYALDAETQQTISLYAQTNPVAGKIVIQADTAYFLVKESSEQTTRILSSSLIGGETSTLLRYEKDYIYDLILDCGVLYGFAGTAVLRLALTGGEITHSSLGQSSALCHCIAVHTLSGGAFYTVTSGIDPESGIRILQMEQYQPERVILNQWKENESIPDGMLSVTDDAVIWITKEIGEDWMTHKMTVYDIQTESKTLYPNALAFTVHENQLYYLAREKGQTNDSTVLYLANVI